MLAPAVHNPSQRPQPDSLWRAMAARSAHKLAPVSMGAPLARDLSVDVAVIGAGYSGLAAAYALQKRGVDCAVFDANPVGWGASGRNGGVVSSKFRLSFPLIDKLHGLDTAKRMHRLAHEGVRVVESFVDEFGLERAHFEHTGSLRCAHTERAFASIRAEADWVRTQLGDASMSVQSREEVTRETGSAGFVGGVLSADAGTILPLEYVCGIARGLTARGVPIYEATPIVEIARSLRGAGGAVLRTPGGVVYAKQVIVATNAYSDLTSATAAYQRELVPFRSAMIATARLPAELDARLMVQRRSYTETRRMMKWFRKVDGRMLFGGRDAFGKEGQATGFDALRRAMVALFPDLADVQIEYKWSGYVGMTFNALPHVGRSDDFTTFCLGYNGAGVAMASLLGQHAAALALGDAPELALLGQQGLRPVPFHSLRAPGVRVVAAWYQFLDAVGA
ncbi:NAD(P)/FAD-dependent oxidoreductase [Paraburkholderia phenoliruptrix]|uniref:FAD dependent oxidoreductase n=2 Tax=Paraburkholderia phenoliruptrix TaxID=252970 RepID=K0DSX2_9BURK|nr:FAD-binding oxidoreductase [Paraburkholderia phenoliruptrix]AFT89246.1 FAD dependent oxidoreductase [Paraburkholderia phenoliruptrix BR3459a]MDR6422098.1 glycine/D-amino acid oxidase-like deaminating enzyme [Paraburkholderia phenoliruptrix]CAB4050812.1 Gamma-glutamylputrescine oxidoreductase [Paraburkholderia phenoliruptrix]